ncbi:unnamed protein product [Protopolystoma xenopodis]|uniref:Uncharacterized protein n=1 Tax=Protopolystoma xenopodis TaxID=117903 RepID=A0A3S5A711_9PLAT|nr:unnamed protein product [Protopolystoma xenopodis]
MQILASFLSIACNLAFYGIDLHPVKLFIGDFRYRSLSLPAGSTNYAHRDGTSLGFLTPTSSVQPYYDGHLQPKLVSGVSSQRSTSEKVHKRSKSSGDRVHFEPTKSIFPLQSFVYSTPSGVILQNTKTKFFIGLHHSGLIVFWGQLRVEILSWHRILKLEQKGLVIRVFSRYGQLFGSARSLYFYLNDIFSTSFHLCHPYILVALEVHSTA